MPRASCSSLASHIIPSLSLQPCVSARLFACYSLHAEKQQTLTKSTSTSTTASTSTPLHRSTRQSQFSQYSSENSHIQPILPLLQSLVHVEVIALGHSKDSNSNSNMNSTLPTNANASSSNNNKHKQTHFSGFDCSSTLTPVDRVDGSNSHQQDSIEALVAAKEQVQALLSLCSMDMDMDIHTTTTGTDSDAENRDATTTTATPSATATTQQVRSCLQTLIHFLGDTMLATSGYGLTLRQECAKSIAVHYPPRRVEKAVTVYRKELETILARLQLQDQDFITSASTSTSAAHFNNSSNFSNNYAGKVLFVEKRLAEFVGQAVRYNLRRFFNKAPPRLTPADTKYEQRLGTYSQVYALVEMEMPDDHENAAVDDECISALVSTALCRIYEFFGLEALLDSSQRPPPLPVLFCQQPASNRGLAIRTLSVPADSLLTDQDMDDILNDIDEATSFLAAAKGCRFLLDLFQIKGVQDEIVRQGGWLEVENHASISWKHDLWKLCPDDAHLVVLCNYAAFLQKIQSWVPLMEQQVSSCQASLDALAKRFHTTTKAKSLLKKYPQIPVIAVHLQEALVRAHSFPLIKSFASN